MDVLISEAIFPWVKAGLHVLAAVVVWVVLALVQSIVLRLFPPRVRAADDPLKEAEIQRLVGETKKRATLAMPMTLFGMAGLAFSTWYLGNALVRRFGDDPQAVVIWFGGEPIVMFHTFAGIALAAPMYNAWYTLRHGREYARLVRIADARYDERKYGGIGRMLHRHGMLIFVLLYVTPVLAWGNLYTVVSPRGTQVAVPCTSGSGFPTPRSSRSSPCGGRTSPESTTLRSAS